jgi:hypothetical protein
LISNVQQALTPSVSQNARKQGKADTCKLKGAENSVKGCREQHLLSWAISNRKEYGEIMSVPQIVHCIAFFFMVFVLQQLQ